MDYSREKLADALLLIECRNHYISLALIFFLLLLTPHFLDIFCLILKLFKILAIFYSGLAIKLIKEVLTLNELFAIVMKVC